LVRGFILNFESEPPFPDVVFPAQQGFTMNAQTKRDLIVAGLGVLAGLPVVAAVGFVTITGLIGI
jgi:hypothetical protein